MSKHNLDFFHMLTALLDSKVEDEYMKHEAGKNIIFIVVRCLVLSARPIYV